MAAGTALFDSNLVATADEAMDFTTNILESSTEYSIIGKDLDGKIVLWNEGARRLYGYEPDKVVGKAESSALYSDQDVRSDKTIRILTNSATRHSYEFGDNW